MGFQRHIKGIVANLGLGTGKAVNLGSDWPAIRYIDVFVNPAATPTNVGSCDLVTSVAASAAAAGVDLTIVAAVEATLRYQPRSLAIAADAGQTEAVTVTGTDQFGNAQTEDITFNGNAVVQGVKVWGSVTKLHCAQRSGAANIGVGLGTILGTSRRVLGLSLDGAVFTTTDGKLTSVQETTRPVKSTTAAVYGVTFSTAIAATKTYVISYLSDEMR